MADIVICDLCGKPMCDYSRHIPRRFKIKEYIRDEGDLPLLCWVRIDAHDSCIKKLLDNANKGRVKNE